MKCEQCEKEIKSIEVDMFGADDMDWIVEAEKINIVIRNIIEWWKREQAKQTKE